MFKIKMFDRGAEKEPLRLFSIDTPELKKETWAIEWFDCPTFMRTLEECRLNLALDFPSLLKDRLKGEYFLVNSSLRWE